MMTKTRGFALSLAVLALACTKAPAPDGGSGWHEESENPSLDSEDAAANDSASADSADTGDPVEDSGEDRCDGVLPSTWTLRPEDTNGYSSPVQAREQLDSQSGLASTSIRTFEFLNEADWRYARPDAGVALDLQLHADEDGTWRLQAAVSAADREERAPLNLVFSIDTSCSMASNLPLATELLATVQDNLLEGDVVSVVTWDTETSVVLAPHAWEGDADDALSALSLAESGATDLYEGLVSAYDLAAVGFDEEALNRVVLVSDGWTNSGETSIELISRQAGSETDNGVYLTGVTLGAGGLFHDELMDRTTGAGLGAGLYLPDAEAIHTHFGERFLQTLDIEARSLELELSLPAGFVREVEAVDAAGRADGDPRPQHLAPGEDVILHWKLAHVCEALLDDEDLFIATVRWLDRQTFEAQEQTVSATYGELLSAGARQAQKGAIINDYAEVLKQFKHPARVDLPAAVAAVQRRLDETSELLRADADLTRIGRELAIVAVTAQNVVIEDTAADTAEP